jgi:hypothetical protein
MIGIIQTGAFLKRNLASFKSWGTDRKTKRGFYIWLAWNMGRDHVCVVADNDKIYGVGVARSINDVKEAKNGYSFAHDGKILFVEHAIAKTNDSFKQLLRFCKARWPQCDKILFRRSKSGKIMKMYDLNTFYRKAGI